MKRYSRFLLIALALAALLFTVVACDGKVNETTVKNTTDSPGTAVKPHGTTAPITVIMTAFTGRQTTAPAPVTTAPVTTAPVTTAAPLSTNPVASYEILSGNANKIGRNFKITAANTMIGLEKLGADGTFSVSVTPGGEGESGIIFGYTKEKGKPASYYRFTVTNRDVHIYKYNGTKSEKIFSQFGSTVGTAAYEIRIVATEGKVYCYCKNRLYSIIEDDVTGKQVGYYAAEKNTSFASAKFNYEKTSPDTVDTLLFGHSYFQGWTAWAKDTKTLFNEFDLGTGDNIGIGGSNSGHWVKMKEALAAYQPKLGIYMIGINDMTAGRSPKITVDDIEETILCIKEHNPEFEIVLISVNHCPSKVALADNIIETNRLMRLLCAKYDWVHLADIEWDLHDENKEPISSYFTSDGLHLQAHTYPEKLIPAIREALKGENQPEDNGEISAQILAEEKNGKLAIIGDYSEYAFTSEQWTEAKPVYEEAVAKVNACNTLSEIRALDLSSYTEKLSAMRNASDIFCEELFDKESCKLYEVAAFTKAMEKSADGFFKVAGCGYRLGANHVYGDMSFSISCKNANPSAKKTLVGALFLASQNDTKGVDGYLFNLETSKNYVQIYYLKNAYGTTATDRVIQYIGGWVFPGSVTDTDFRVIIEDGYVYVCTEESYLKSGKDGYGCKVDLSYSGQYTAYEKGHLGILSWDSYTGNIAIDNINGKEIEK